ncbi:zinc finger protein 84 [Brachionichthys hirsutus]|uniref:zinc finger protein 84 n=1 Tax=Brachionichthys hirsutus TaxID=412623 RepID=UPI0036054278
MAAVMRRYRDISPVTLHLEGGAVTSSLYCEEAGGLSGELVESFLVELYRCKLCQFTCRLKASVSSHLLLEHRPPTLTYLGEADESGGNEDREEAVLQREACPYRLDLNGQSKQSDEDEEFLLYNMLDNISPPACDIGGEGGLQVAHTCEVSTLFVEENSIFPLKGGPVDLSCHIEPPTTQEELAQSAHLMTLGLCRISNTKPPPAPPSKPTCPSSGDRPPPTDSLKPKGADGDRPGTAPGERGLPCLLCPLTLPSQRLLSVHVRSHRAAGGFSCVCCSWTADSWEQLQPHWRSHCRRRRRRRRRKREDQIQEKRTTLKQSHRGRLHRSGQSGSWRSRLIGRAGGRKEEERGDSPTSRPGSCSPEMRQEEEKEEEEEAGFCCSLCHRMFSSKLTLRRHLGVHGGEKPFTCPHCPYSSRLKASLLQHLRTHTGEKPYRCAECPYASIDRSSLLRHSRTHSQEKPYKCQRCDYSSIQKKSLDLHARRHHTGEAFPCQQCKYSSPDRHLLLRHVRRNHAPPSKSHCDLTGDRAL